MKAFKMEAAPSWEFRKFPVSYTKSHLVGSYINSVKRNDNIPFYQILILLISYKHIGYENF